MSDGCNLPHVQAESTTLQAVDMAAFEHGEGAGITKYEKVFLSYATNILRGCPLMSCVPLNKVLTSSLNYGGCRLPSWGIPCRQWCTGDTFRESALVSLFQRLDQVCRLIVHPVGTHFCTRVGASSVEHRPADTKAKELNNLFSEN